MSDGVRVGGGRLRVDAARAVSKLREYQLPDPTLWTLEVVRAAVLLGASALHIEADSDDVWIGWEGAPLPERDLSRLLDHLVSSGPEHRGPRLLAMGVNTALALHPRFVDVWSIDARCLRTRYTPQLLLASGDGHSESLGSLMAEEVPRPEWILRVRRGSAVHVRRSLGMETLARALRQEVPPEVHRVLAAANALRIPLHADPRPVPAAGPLVRMELGGAGRRGFAEILPLEQASGPAHLVWSELGVVLAAQALPLGKERPDSRVPIVVQLDVDRLPTNAARSAVRENEALIEDGLRQAVKVVHQLVQALAQQIEQALRDGEHGRHHELRKAAIAIVRAQLDGADWMTEVRTAPSRVWYNGLLEVPVARDALGRPRTLRELARAKSDVVHRAAAPVRPELATWLADVPWVPPGDPLYTLYGQPPGDASTLVALAEQSAAARLAFLNRPEVDPQLPSQPHDLASVSVRHELDSSTDPHSSWVVSHPLGGLDGWVAITSGVSQAVTAGVLDPHSEITVLWKNRVIHRDRVPSEMPFRALLHGPTLAPNADFSGVLDHDALAGAIRAAGWAAVRAAEQLATAYAGEATSAGPATQSLAGPHIEATLRAALRLALRLTTEESRQKSAVQKLVARPGPLASARIFEVWDGTRLSLREVQAVADERGVVGTASRLPKRSIHGRLVLALQPAEVQAMPQLLSARAALPAPSRKKRPKAQTETFIAMPLEAQVVPYGDELAVRTWTAAEELARTVWSSVVLYHEEPSYRAAVGVMTHEAQSVIHLHHVGRRIPGTIPFPDQLGSDRPHAQRPAAPLLALAIDDDGLIPTPAFSGLASNVALGRPRYAAEVWSARLALALADHLGRLWTPTEHSGRLLGKPSPWLRAEASATELLILLAKLDGSDPQNDLLGDRRARLRELPALPRLGSGTLRPLAFFLATSNGVLGFVEGCTTIEPLPGLEATTLASADATALGRFFSVPVEDRSARARVLIAAAERERAKSHFLERPVEPPFESSGRVSLSGSEILSGTARPCLTHQARVVVRARGRRVFERSSEALGRALEVCVDVEVILVDLERMELTDAGFSRVKGAAKNAAGRLLAGILANDPAQVGQLAPWTSLALAFVKDLPKKRTNAQQSLLEALLRAPCFPSIDRGALVSVLDALRESQNEICFARELEGWLGALPEQKPHALDRAPVLAFPSEAEERTQERYLLARELAGHLGNLRDVTREARRLRDARRVARGAGGAARLPDHVDRRFVVSLKTIAQSTKHSDMLLEVLPDGEAALVDSTMTRVVLIDHLTETSRSYPLVPAVLIVARSPLSCELDDEDAAATMERAVRIVVAEVLRWTIDRVPSAFWDPAIRRSIRRASLLGGATHLDRIADAPIFATNTATFVSYQTLREQVNRFGDLWAVSDANDNRQPLDPDRWVLVLEEHQHVLLNKQLPVSDGKLELAIDAQARINMARPRVETLSFTANERAWGASVAPFDTPDGQGWIMPLDPQHTPQRGLETLRDRRPLGITEDPCRWPTRIRIDAPMLTPNRSHDAPILDEVLERIHRAAREASEVVLKASWPRQAGAFEFEVDDDVSRNVFTGRGVEVRGLLRWSGLDPQASQVQVIDPDGTYALRLEATAPKALLPDPVPLSGVLHVVGARVRSLPKTQLDALARRAYAGVLQAAAGILSRGHSAQDGEARELALAALVQGAIVHSLAGLKRTVHATPLPFLGSGDSTLEALSRAARSKAPVFSLEPHQAKVAPELPANALILFRDGSLSSQAAHTLLSHRIQTLSEWMNDAPPSEASPKATKAASKSKPKTQQKATPTSLPPIEVLARRAAQLARSISPNLPGVRVAPHALLVRAREHLLVSLNHPLSRAAEENPQTWPHLVPLIAAEMLRETTTLSEAALVSALLDALSKD